MSVSYEIHNIKLYIRSSTANFNCQTSDNEPARRESIKRRKGPDETSPFPLYRRLVQLRPGNLWGEAGVSDRGVDVKETTKPGLSGEVLLSGVEKT